MEQKFLYGIDDMFNKWNEIMTLCKKYSQQRGVTFYENGRNSAFAVSILSFYGLTPDEIVELKLSDVTESGIKGRDIRFDDKALNFLLEYKCSDGYDRGTINGDFYRVYYKQATFIRTAEDTEITNRTLTGLFKKSQFAPNDDVGELLELFKPKRAYRAGRYDTLYNYVETTGENLFKGDRTNIKFIKDHYEDLDKIIDGDYNADDWTTYISRFAVFRRKYYVARTEWEAQKKIEAERKQQLEVKQIEDNQDTYKQKLLDKIVAIETELKDVRELLNLLN